MFGSLGPFELILIFLVVLLIFGAKRIPEIARGLGKGISEFKSATREISSEISSEQSSGSQRQQHIQQPRSPDQGTPNPRGPAPEQQPTSEEPPPEPERAENPSPQKDSA